MKKLKLTSALLIVALTFSACKKDRDNNTNRAKNAKEFAAQHGPKMQRSKINNGEENTIRLAGGTSLKFAANSFTINGQPVNGEVVIEAYEMLKRSDVLFSGTNTNHISGAPLISHGFIFIDAKVNGVSVDKKLANPVTISILSDESYTQIWEGVNDDGQFAWAEPQQDAAGNGGIREVGNKNGEFIFDFGNLGWVNCDIFFSNSAPKTTVKVTVSNNPGDMASYYGGGGHTYVYFCAKGDNVVAQLYTPDGANTVKSYDNSMPIGAEGKFISFSIKDEKFYYAEQETTITANQHLTLSLTETTESAIQSAIDSLNDY